MMTNFTLNNDTLNFKDFDSTFLNDTGLLGKTHTTDLVWIIPIVIAIIIMLFFTALGLFHCFLGIGNCCQACCYEFGCYIPKRRRAYSEERLRLTENPTPMYESSGDTETTFYQMREVGVLSEK